MFNGPEQLLKKIIIPGLIGNVHLVGHHSIEYLKLFILQ